jgi:hypothetical protein
MMDLTNYTLSQQHMDRWSGLLVAEAAPFFVPETLRPLIPPEILLFARSSLAQLRLDLAMLDSYTLYAVQRAYQDVVFLRNADFLDLSPALREQLLYAQWQAGRGQVYAWEQISHYFTPALQAQAEQYLVDTEQGRKLVLEYALWQQLPSSAQEQWLKEFVALNGHPYPTLPTSRLESIPSAAPTLRSLANTFAFASGPNCLSTALAGISRNSHVAQTISTLWLQQDMFLQGLRDRGYTPNPAVSADDQDLVDAVFLWNDASGTPQHACLLIGAGLALNKNSQAWYTARHIAALHDIIDYWQEDNLQIQVYTRKDSSDKEQ